MTESTWRETMSIVEQVAALFVESCPLCGKKPDVQMFYRTRDSLEPQWFDLQEERWRLRIACWNNDLPRDEICMLKTAPGAKAFYEAISFSVSAWNDKDYRAAMKEQCLGKSYEERCQIPKEIAPGIHNGAPGVAWMKEKILGWIKELP